jgi:hypothetical protein
MATKLNGKLKKNILRECFDISFKLLASIKLFLSIQMLPSMLSKFFLILFQTLFKKYQFFLF